MSIPSLSLVSNGLNPDSNGSQVSLISSGLDDLPNPQLGPLDSSPALIAAQGQSVATGLSEQGQLLSDGTYAPAVTVGTGITIGPNLPLTNLNNILPNLLPAPAISPFNPAGSVAQELSTDAATYTGSDLRIVVDLVNTTLTSQTAPQLKQLIECTTFTISIHREKAAVRAAGYINPKGFARGRRTIAGTLVLTQYTVDALYNFLKSQNLSAHDLSKDTQYTKVDQLPAFNMTLLFTNEYGNVSYRRVLGVEFVTDGVVYSSNDMLAEQTISYMAADFTPLMDLASTPIFHTNITSQVFAPERTVQTVLSNNKQQNAIPSTNIFSPSSSVV
jgi:hypothetical protein